MNAAVQSICLFQVLKSIPPMEIVASNNRLTTSKASHWPCSSVNYCQLCNGSYMTAWHTINLSNTTVAPSCILSLPWLLSYLDNLHLWGSMISRVPSSPGKFERRSQEKGREAVPVSWLPSWGKFEKCILGTILVIITTTSCTESTACFLSLSTLPPGTC